MVPNLYKTLGVTKDASKSDIDESYRRLARKYHPDLNQGDPSAKERFQEVQHAAEILRDENKRRNYDELLRFLRFNYGIDLDSVSADEATTQDVEPASGPDEPARMELERVFRAFSPRGKDRDDDPIRGLDLHRQLEVPFTTSVVGGEVPFELKRETKSDKVLVKIPPGIENGWKLRLRGQGNNGKHGGDPGDLILTVFITPDPHILRHGKNLEIEVPVDGAVAKFGGNVNICTPRGEITLTVPPGTLHEQRLRIIGLGVVGVDGSPGDLIACIKVVGPLPIDEEPSSPTVAEIDIDDQEDPTKRGCNDTQETVNSAMPVPPPHREATEEPSESLGMSAELDSEHDSFEPHVAGEPVGEVEELAIQPVSRNATREASDPETVQQLERDVAAAQGQEVESTQRGELEEPRKSDNPPKESEPASSSNSSEQSETATHDAEHHGFIVFLGVLSFALFLISVLGWGWQPDSIFTPSFSYRAASGTSESNSSSESELGRLENNRKQLQDERIQLASERRSLELLLESARRERTSAELAAERKRQTLSALETVLIEAQSSQTVDNLRDAYFGLYSAALEREMELVRESGGDAADGELLRLRLVNRLTELYFAKRDEIMQSDEPSSEKHSRLLALEERLTWARGRILRADPEELAKFESKHLSP